MAVPKSALPSHIKGESAPSANGTAEGFKRNHHGKSQSHMVSRAFLDSLHRDVVHKDTFLEGSKPRSKTHQLGSYWEGAASPECPLKTYFPYFRHFLPPPSHGPSIVPTHIKSCIPHHSIRFLMRKVHSASLIGQALDSKHVARESFWHLPRTYLRP